jgi:sigma-E factor negative regulatory protein RseA
MNQHEEISAWMDGAAEPGREDGIATRVSVDPDSRSRWDDWHLIGDVMRSSALARPSGLSDALNKRLESEPLHLPVARAEGPGRERRGRKRQLVYGAAVAAAVAFVAVVAVAPQMQQGGVVEMLANAVAPQAPSAGRPAVEPLAPLMAEDPRLRDLLDAHGSMSIRPVSVEVR